MGSIGSIALKHPGKVQTIPWVPLDREWHNNGNISNYQSGTHAAQHLLAADLLEQLLKHLRRLRARHFVPVAHATGLSGGRVCCHRYGQADQATGASLSLEFGCSHHCTGSLSGQPPHLTPAFCLCTDGATPTAGKPRVLPPANPSVPTAPTQSNPTQPNTLHDSNPTQPNHHSPALNGEERHAAHATCPRNLLLDLLGVGRRVVQHRRRRRRVQSSPRHSR